ncbi:MAG: hypothetical protein JNN05_09755 [Candidatus Omnitrophica bacterium]|nr:hypothetical protein [Candidatus Omnitrophota bacterium]
MSDQNQIAKSLESTINQGEHRLKDALCDAEKKMKQGQEQMAKWATDVDKQARENPWPLVTGVGIGCLLLGVILGKSKV